MPTPTHRRRLALASAGLMLGALALAGCGQDEPAAAPAATAPPSEATTTPATEGDTGTTGVAVAAREDVFSVLSPWNQPVTDAPVHIGSDYMLRAAQLRSGVDRDGRVVRTLITDQFYINTEAWTVPVVSGGVPTALVCRQAQCGDGSGELVVAVPADVDPDPRYDGWMTVFDTERNVAYDLWRARREEDGSISYQYRRDWDLDGPGFSQPYLVSARSSGLPLFAGLIRPGELERCEINHALAIAVPGPAAGNFVQPASATNGNGLPKSLPMGARIRLKAAYTPVDPVDRRTGKALPFTAEQSRLAGCLLTALRTYGAIVVDRAAVPTLFFQRLPQDTPKLLQGYELQQLDLTDFEALDFSASDRYEYPSQDDDLGTSGLDADLDVNSLDDTPVEAAP
ncbi:hypothetical protein [Nocardioides sp.]|uniref:hypothetical protein n=1 Tax=Nocardioides sp. TaxID=35761 RepID=UPI0035194107